MKLFTQDSIEGHSLSNLVGITGMDTTGLPEMKIQISFSGCFTRNTARISNSMPRYQIPRAAGEFEIFESKAGSPMVWNRKTGRGKILIPCRDEAHAQEVLEKVSTMKNGGELWV